MSTKTTALPAAWPLPEGMIDAMRETAYHTLSEWLEAAGVPAEVRELLNHYAGLEFIYGEMRGQCPYDPLSGVQETVTQAANAIAALGGGFHGAASAPIEHIKENAQAWASARQ